jgi:hypothetical protein
VKAAWFSHKAATSLNVEHKHVSGGFLHRRIRVSLDNDIDLRSKSQNRLLAMFIRDFV